MSSADSSPHPPSPPKSRSESLTRSPSNNTASASTTTSNPLKPVKTNTKNSHWNNSSSPFKSYMHHKNRKLRSQYVQQFRSSTKSNLLSGVTVWVDGHTNPSRERIRTLLGENGAKFETYFSNSVTHVIASNLAHATRKRFTTLQKSNPRLYLVHPDWLVQSISHKRRLPERSFPIRTMTDTAQRSISTFFPRTTNKNPK